MNNTDTNTRPPVRISDEDMALCVSDAGLYGDDDLFNMLLSHAAWQDREIRLGRAREEELVAAGADCLQRDSIIQHHSGAADRHLLNLAFKRLKAAMEASAKARAGKP